MPGTCLSWTILALSVVSFALSISALATCRFALIVPDSFLSVSYSDYPGFGLFKFENVDGNCESWPDEIKDAIFEAPEKVARAFGVVAAVLIGLAMVIVMLLALILDLGPAINKLLWNVVRIFFSIAIFSQYMTLGMLASDFCGVDEFCVPGPSGIVAITNGFLLLVISIMCCCIPPPEPAFEMDCGNSTGYEDQDKDDEDDEEEGTDTSVLAPPVPRGGGSEAVETLIEIDADGNKKTTKTVINSDGSKMTTITKEQAQV